MWDNAPLLRSITRALVSFSVLAMLCGAVYYTVRLPDLLPIRSVRLSAVPQRVAADDVLALVRREVQGNFFTVDIAGLRKSLEKLPWVRNVSIRREFPNSLAVEFEEHQPLAHWNDGALVNRQGEVFVAETAQQLPSFIGIEGSSAEVAQEYEKFSRQLAVLKLSITRLVLSPRHAWQMQLSNEMVVQLGREDMQQRLARFVAVYPYSLDTMRYEATTGHEVRTGAQVGAHDLKIRFVDMRYRNGFVVRAGQGNA